MATGRCTATAHPARPREWTGWPAASRPATSGSGVDALRRDQHRGAVLIGHDPVVGIPVVMCPAGRGEDLAQQETDTLSVHVAELVVRARQVRRALGRHPL